MAGELTQSTDFKTDVSFLTLQMLGADPLSESGFVLDVGSGRHYGQWYDRIFPE